MAASRVRHGLEGHFTGLQFAREIHRQVDGRVVSGGMVGCDATFRNAQCFFNAAAATVGLAATSPGPFRSPDPGKLHLDTVRRGPLEDINIILTSGTRGEFSALASGLYGCVLPYPPSPDAFIYAHNFAYVQH